MPTLNYVLDNTDYETYIDEDEGWIWAECNILGTKLIIDLDVAFDDDVYYTIEQYYIDKIEQIIKSKKLIRNNTETIAMEVFAMIENDLDLTYEELYDSDFN